jgi:hypothetical protein
LLTRRSARISPGSFSGRVKRVKTELGFKVVQDCNAYGLHPPRGLGVLAVQLFRGFALPFPTAPKKGGLGPAKEARRVNCWQ